MVSLSDVGKNSWFESEESEELSPSTSVVLQSSMARGWEKVLRRRAVAHIGASLAARSRAVRLLQMAKRRSLALEGKPMPVPPVSVKPVARSLPEECHSDAGEDSDDEPLARKVAPQHSVFRSSTFTVATMPVESDEEQEESDEHSSASSECEEASEVDSESDSDDGGEEDAASSDAE
jgi:hypothetical protein